jgi:hypothetical protein
MRKRQKIAVNYYNFLKLINTLNIFNAGDNIFIQYRKFYIKITSKIIYSRNIIYP